MAFVATMSTKESRSFSGGPVKYQYFTWTTVSGDTSGTVTADHLGVIFHIVLDGGLAYTAAPTFSGNVATLAFTDPAASRFGTGFCIGRG